MRMSPRRNLIFAGRLFDSNIRKNACRNGMARERTESGLFYHGAEGRVISIAQIAAGRMYMEAR